MTSPIPFARRRSPIVQATLVAVASSLTLLLLPAGASAVVTSVSTAGGATTVGMQPRSISNPLEPPKALFTFGNPKGAPVMHSSADYAIYWDPEYGFHGDWEHLVNTFLQKVGASSGSHIVNSVDEQYTDKSNGHAAYSTTFRGAYSDRTPYPTSGCVDPNLSLGFPDKEAHKDDIACLTDEQIKQELQAFIARNGLHTGMGTVFFLMTPPGVTVCVDGGGSVSSYCSDDAPSASSEGHSFCSYHAAITDNPSEGDEKTVLYAVIPWSAGGIGDYQLFDRAPGYECQDGGYDPTSKPLIEQAETERHQQEPNQLQPLAPGSDGSPDTGLADLIINQMSVEQRDISTDPLLNAWQDSAGNEVTDECRNFFAATLGGSSNAVEGSGSGTLYNQQFAEGKYYLNDTLDFAALLQRYPGVPCIPGIFIEPQFTAPNSVNAGDIVGFDAAESNVTLDAGVGYSSSGVPFETFPTYTWSFGDGTKTTSPYPPGASQVNEPSAFHSYQYGGTYEVTLTITDVGGNTASTSRTVTVVGPPRPAPAPSSTSQASAQSTTTSPSTTSSSSTTKTVTKGMPAPTIREHVGSHSLASVLGSGLALGYTVNEQVAGHVEVLLDAATAKRLGIHGRTARNLPKGYSRQVVIGATVLVTTKGGHGELKLKLPKAVAEHLAHVQNVKLTLRIIVRNAARHHPKTTTLMSVVMLKR